MIWWGPSLGLAASVQVSGVCMEAAEVVKMQVLTFSRSRSAPQCTSHLLPGCINS